MSNITLPGLIDPHVHLRDPGQTDKEDFFTGTSAALSGGFTTVIDMPNNIKPITTLERLEEKKAIAQEKIVCDIGFHFGTLGDNLNEFEKVTDNVLGLKLYLNETTGNFLISKDKLLRIFTAWKDAQNLPEHSMQALKPILVHAEDEILARVIEIAKQTSVPTHICHISDEFELTLIMQAKEQGIPITCGVTPHHLFLSKDDEKYLGPFGMMKPILKSKKDVEFLWKHLGAIDIIESDHAPHTFAEKEGNHPHYGVPGLETTLPLLLTAVSENKLSIEEVVRLCCEGSSKIFDISNDAQTTIEVDLNTEYEIKNENLYTKCKWTPFNGWKVKGKVMRVFLHGKKVFENGKILSKPGAGNIIP